MFGIIQERPSNYFLKRLCAFGSSLDIQIKNYRLLNKPPETEEDSNFQSIFKTITNFNIPQDSSKSFDELSFGNSYNDYILFVRKK